MLVDGRQGQRHGIGNYDLFQKIADGSMSSVYQGRDRATGQVVAVKIFKGATQSNEVLLARFQQEFQAAASLEHPNLVRALDFGWEESCPYLVMEFVEGESLGQCLERKGRLEEKEAVGIIVQVAKALAAVHARGLIHRDIKPDNILLTLAGEAKLTDFGLVKDLDAQANLTRDGRGLGTLPFMPPEQFRGARHADQRSDLYSLAATLYAALTGGLPFDGCNLVEAWTRKLREDMASPRKLVPTLSEHLDRAIRQAMSADPDRRQATCEKFIEDLTGPACQPSSEPAEQPGPDLLPGDQASMPTEQPVCPTILLAPPASALPPETANKPSRIRFVIESLTWLIVGLAVVASFVFGLYVLGR